jgi:hypothetical protein
MEDPDQIPGVEPIPSDAPLRQGDVLRWPKNTAFLEMAGVVVTADCDLARGKHWGRLSVVPVFALGDYVEELLAPKLLSKNEQRIVQHLARSIGRGLALAGGERPSVEAIELLISNHDLPPALAADASIHTLHRAIRQGRGWEKYDTNINCLDAALRILNPQLANQLRESIRNNLSSLPGDVMQIPKSEHLPFDPPVAWLRVLREVRDDAIALRMSEADSAGGIRVGRLSPVVRYRLTQMLAQVFSDIGLPESFEKCVKDETVAYVGTLGQSAEG